MAPVAQALAKKSPSGLKYVLRSIWPPGLAAEAWNVAEARCERIHFLGGVINTSDELCFPMGHLFIPNQTEYGISHYDC